MVVGTLSQNSPSSRLNRRRKRHQQRLIKSVITAIRTEIHRLHPIIHHRVHQARDVRRIDGRAVDDDGALAAIPARNRLDRRVVLVIGKAILELDHRVAVAEERGRAQGARVEDHGRHVRGHGRVRVGRGVVHVRVDRRAGRVVDVVEEDARDRDVGFRVA